MLARFIFPMLIFTCALIPASVAGSIHRVEPPFWWAGMHNPRLQLLIHGEHIGETTPSITYPGVSIERTVRVANNNYLFVDINIGRDALPGTFEITLSESGTIIASHSYSLMQREANSAQRQGFNAADMIYLITPDRFANSLPENDNAENMTEQADRSNLRARHGGDIQGVIDHLDYLHGLGITSIWLNPVLENNQPRSSYHGYSTTDFYNVDPRFGSNADYRRLSEEMARRGMKLVMDMIANHCGSQHWWMKDLPTSDWVNYQSVRDAPPISNHRKTLPLDPYADPADGQGMTDGWFVRTMPDLNQRNALLATYLIQNSIWWIEYAGLAGIRQDTYPYPDKEFMADWSCRIMEEYPNLNIVGEVWVDNPVLLAYWQKDKVNSDGYTSCLPSLFDFPMQMAMVRALQERGNFNTGLNRLYDILANDVTYADPFNFVIFPDNHDMSRILTQLNDDIRLTKMALAYVATMRGIPQIFYGTEIAMTNTGDNSHENIRSDYPGGWPGDNTNAFTGENLTVAQRDMQSFFAHLFNWRKSQPVVHSGKLRHYIPQDDVYVYFRYSDDDVVMVAMNNSDEPRMLDMSRFHRVVQARTLALDPISGRLVDVSGGAEVAPRTALILDFE